MHFFVLKENLAKALSIVGRYIPIRPQLPILANVHFKTENNQLKISATNLELGIIFTTAAKIEKDGEITVPGKLLAEFISSLTAEKIEFVLDGNTLIIKTGKTRATFATTSPADFPPFPATPDAKKTFPLDKVKDAITRVVFAASNDEARPVLTGVKTTISKGVISLSATDGYRLSMEQVEIEDKKEELGAILPANSLIEVIRVAAETKAETVGFSIIENKNQVIFIFPQVQIYTRLLEGEFPNIEKIIPVGFKTRVIVEKELLAQSVKTTSLFARGAANIIKIKIEKDGMRLSANTPQVGEDEDFVEAKVEGEEVEVAFNFRFLLDLLANFPDKELIFETSGPLNPGVFKPATNKLSFLHIIMPVRVQG